MSTPVSLARPSLIHFSNAWRDSVEANPDLARIVSVQSNIYAVKKLGETFNLNKFANPRPTAKKEPAYLYHVLHKICIDPFDLPCTPAVMNVNDNHWILLIIDSPRLSQDSDSWNASGLTNVFCLDSFNERNVAVESFVRRWLALFASIIRRSPYTPRCSFRRIKVARQKDVVSCGYQSIANLRVFLSDPAAHLCTFRVRFLADLLYTCSLVFTEGPCRSQ